MALNHDTQTTSSNDNITELDNEQDLLDITGVGLVCLGVTALAGIEGSIKLKIAQKTNNVNKCAQAIDHLNLAKDASRTASLAYVCPKCPENAIKYVAMKIT